MRSFGHTGAPEARPHTDTCSARAGAPLRLETAHLSGAGSGGAPPPHRSAFGASGPSRPAQGSVIRRGPVPATNNLAAVVKPCGNFGFEN